MLKSLKCYPNDGQKKVNDGKTRDEAFLQQRSTQELFAQPATVPSRNGREETKIPETLCQNRKRELAPKPSSMISNRTTTIAADRDHHRARV